MTREHLQAASEALREAAAAVEDEDIEERAYSQSREMAQLAAADRGPDQGRLDRHMNVLRDIAESTDGEASERVEDALERVTEYRKTVGGI